MRDETQSYLKALERKLKTGDATEQTHRGALERYVESTASRITVLNEARHIACGAPDLTVRNGPVPVGHIECKDIGADLNRIEKSDQLKRYREGLSNLILTDHLEFLWFRDGEKVRTLRIGSADGRGRIAPDPEGAAALELLLAEFVDDEAKTIARADDLARRMAGQTRLIYDTLIKALEQERGHAKETGVPPDSLSFHGQLEGFREALIPDLSEEDFADMYAQTIAYGLFAARWEHDPAKLFDRKSATFELPKTNPFLARTFVRIGGADMDDNLHWIVDDLAEVLNRTDLAAIRRAFRGETRRDDPVVHFYETFLAAYDSKRREARGVYYTPGPVVEFIVKSVDKLLKRDFGLPNGLSDETRLEDGPAYTDLDPDCGIEGTVHKVQVLDPAAGTGTFLHHVVDHIFHDRFNLPGAKSLKGQWPAYVRDHLLPRLNGFEFLMAPYAIGHLKLNLKLKETGAELHGGERINLFLTNTLEEPPDLAQKFRFTQWLVDEAKAAGAVKRDMPVMVVLGNPPYSGHSQNPSEREVEIAQGAPVESYSASSFAPKISAASKDLRRKQRTFIGHLLKGWDPDAQKPAESYFHIGGEPLGERNPKWLQDDYVKFIRFSQWRIERTGHGILAFITNNGYLDNPTFRGMRHSLLRAFDDLYILDLHGSTLKKERAPDGTKDENVFDIQPGVAILIAVRKPGPRPAPIDGKPPLATVHHKDLWGRREVFTDNDDGTKTVTGGKYHWLAANDVETVDWDERIPLDPGYFFAPRDEKLYLEFLSNYCLSGMFVKFNIGMAFGRDALFSSFSMNAARDVIEALRNESLQSLRSRFRLARSETDSGWTLANAQKDTAHDVKYIRTQYRPFDYRFTGYTGRSNGLHARPRSEITDLMIHENLGLSCAKGTEVYGGWEHILVSDEPINLHTVSLKEVNYVFPTYDYETKPLSSFDFTPWPAGPGGRRPNLDKGVVDRIAAGIELDFISDGRGDLAATFGPEDLVDWIYAVLHAPSYRTRYAEFLKSDFPRVPFPTSKEYAGPGFFAALCAKGRRLVDLHLMRDADDGLKPGFPVAGDNTAARPRWQAPDSTQAGESGRVWLNATQYFDGVPKETWDFRIGGYQVCEKWLKDRRDRDLSGTDIETYRTIVAALTETRQVMADIDAEIEKNGGWPIR